MYYFDKRARSHVSRYMGEKLFARVEDQLDVYAVLGDEGRLVTLDHRTIRFRRP